MPQFDTSFYGTIRLPTPQSRDQREAAEALRETREANRDLVRERQQELAQKSQENLALRQAMARFPNDPEKAATWLAQNGYGSPEIIKGAREATRAGHLSTEASEQARLATVKADLAAWEQIYGITRFMKTPEGYRNGRTMILAADPKLAQFLPETWEAGGEAALAPFDTFLISAKEQMDDATTRRGQNMAQVTAFRGQDVGANTAHRGQDITADTALAGQQTAATTARRGQDIGATTAYRGQDIGAATARRGQDLTNARAAAAGTTGRPPTVMQNRTLNFFNRAKQADDDINTVEEGIAQSGLPSQVYREWAPNWAQSKESQMYAQAQRAFTEARLRKDSGAAIPPHELENDRKTYFVQAGDDPKTVAQKKRARATMLSSLAFESGPALEGFYGDDAAPLLEHYKAQSVSTDRAGGGKKLTKEIPGFPGTLAESTDGGKTWKRVK